VRDEIARYERLATNGVRELSARESLIDPVVVHAWLSARSEAMEPGEFEPQTRVAVAPGSLVGSRGKSHKASQLRRDTGFLCWLGVVSRFRTQTSFVADSATY